MLASGALYGALSFSASGRHVLVSAGTSVWLGETDTLREKLRIVQERSGRVYVSWSDNGRRLMLTEFVDSPAPRQCGQHWRVRVIDPNDPDKWVVGVGYRSATPGGPVSSVDGRVVLSGRRAVYELSTGNPLAHVRDPFYIDAVLPGGTAMATPGNWGEFEVVTMLDELWVMSPATVRVLLAIATATAMAIAIFLGRPVRRA